MSLARLLSVGIVLMPPLAGAAPPFDAALAAYQGAPRCDGAAYWRMVSLRDQAYFDFQLQDPGQAGPSRVKAEVAAAEADAIADTAAGKGCAVQARQNWSYVLRSFSGTIFTPFLREAVAGIRGSRDRMRQP